MSSRTTTILGVRIPHELKATLNQLADKTGESRNRLVNIALQEFIQAKYPEFLTNS